MAFHKTTTIDYKVYAEINGEMRYIANTTDVTLPEIVYKTEEMNFSGMGGTIDFPNHFNTEAMTFEMGNTTDAQTTGLLLAPGIRTIEVRWTGNVLNSEDLGLSADKHRLVMKVMAQKYTPGKIERGAAMDTSNAFSVLYMKKELNGTEIFEIDVLNRKLVVDGVDYSQDINSFLG